MLQSKYCVLSEKTNLTKSDLGECENDFGGYFIINGSEKVLVSQEKVAENKVYVFKNSKNSSKFSHSAEIKSITPDKFTPSKNISVKLTNKTATYGKTIKVSIPHVRQEIPLFIVFRALGIESDKEIIEHIVYETKSEDSHKIMSLLRNSLEESLNVQTQEIALEYISKYTTMLN